MMLIDNEIQEFELNKNLIIFNPSDFSLHKFDKDAPKERVEALIKELPNNKINIDLTPKIGTLYLLLSNGCNLRCKYCIVSDLLKTDNINMTYDIAKKGIDLFFKNWDKTFIPQIILYGGEPLLNQEVLKKIVKYLNSFRLKKRIILITNGTLLNKEILLFLKKEKVNISISLDGKEENNKFRVDSKGQPVYSRVINNINLMKELHINFSISLTITNENVNHLKEIAEFFVEELKVKSLSFNLLKNPPKTFKEIPDINIVSKELIRAFNYLKNKGVYEDTMMKTLRPFLKEKIKVYSCSGYGGQLAIGPNGNIGPCQALLDNDKFIIGNVNDSNIDEKIRKSNILREWSRRTPLLMDKCKDCKYRFFCGGNCAADMINKGKYLYSIDDNYCKFIKEIIGWFFNEL